MFHLYSRSINFFFPRRITPHHTQLSGTTQSSHSYLSDSLRTCTSQLVSAIPIQPDPPLSSAEHQQILTTRVPRVHRLGSPPLSSHNHTRHTCARKKNPPGGDFLHILSRKLSSLRVVVVDGHPAFPLSEQIIHVVVAYLYNATLSLLRGPGVRESVVVLI